MPYLTPDPTDKNVTSPIIKRLYISPFNPIFISTILPTTAISVVPNPSYHQIETFPEKSYGYLDLPSEEAQQVKKKLNGSILRGRKMRVEDARPQKRKHRSEKEVENGTGDKDEQLQNKRSEKETRKDGVLLAIKLIKNREVKRGWTQPAVNESRSRRGLADEASKKERSQLLFRTNLPPNVASKTADMGVRRRSWKREVDGKAWQAVQIKEFTKTTKCPTFLRDSQMFREGKKSATYEEGKGWIDDGGNVVEAVRERHSSRRPQGLSVKAPTVETVCNGASLRSGEHEREESLRTLDDRNSNLGISSEDANNFKAAPVAGTSSPTPANTLHAQRKTRLPRHDTFTASKASTTIATRLSPAISPATAIKDVHPLEALFKRPTSQSATTTNSKPPTSGLRPAPIMTSFSFFEADYNGDAYDNNVHDGEETGWDSASLQPPQTPFTRRDIEYRGIRSAAPTPDTAAIGKKFSLPWAEIVSYADLNDEENVKVDNRGTSPIKLGPVEDEDDDNYGDDDDDIHKWNSNTIRPKTKKEDTFTAPIKEKMTEETPFEKRFWEQRGENNRNWKARVREKKKEKRQEDNRSGVGRIAGY